MRYAIMHMLFFKNMEGEYDISLIYHIEQMEIFLYAVIFIIGTFFGSFFTLAVYRIPRKEDILVKHSYCPSCNHKLGFFDLFPIFSYLFLGGKCRYCKQKIRPRYLILELLTGFTFVIVAFSIKISLQNINSIINTIVILLYISILFIIAGIDKEIINIQTNVILFGLTLEVFYIIYQCTLKGINVYQYVIYFILLIIIFIILCLNFKLKAEERYDIQLLYLSLYIAVFSSSINYILTMILTIIMVRIHQILSHKTIPIGFYLCSTNTFVIIVSNILTNYII